MVAESWRATLPLAAAVLGWAMVVHGVLWWLAWWPAPKALWGDENLYLQSARDLLAGVPDWAPMPLWSSGYPRFLAGILGLSGGSLVAIQLVQALLLIMTALVLGDLVERTTGSKRAAIVTGGWVVAFPSLVAYEQFLWPEVPHLALFVAVLWLLFGEPPMVFRSVLAGTALGLALLMKAVLLGFVPVLLWLAFWRRGGARSPMCAGLCIAALLLVMVPESIRQHRETESWMPSNSGVFNLWVGLAESGRATFSTDHAWNAYQEWFGSGETFRDRQDFAWREVRDHIAGHRVAAVVREQLSSQYFRLFGARSYLVEQLPGGAAVPVGSGYLRAPLAAVTLVVAVASAMYALLLILAPLGWSSPRRGGRVAIVLGLLVAYHLVLFFGLHATPRFQVPLYPALFWGAGIAAGEGVSLWRRDRMWRLVMAAAVSLVMLWLAFSVPLP